MKCLRSVKTNVAIEAIKGEKSYVEIASTHNIPKKEDAPSFIDKLNRLEKLNIIDAVTTKSLLSNF